MYSFQLKNIGNKKMSLFMEKSIPKVMPNYSYTPRKNNVVFISYGNLINKFIPRIFQKSMIQIVNEPFHTCGCK